MVAKAKKWTTPLSGEMLSSLVSFLNDNSEQPLDPKLGIQLEFMERNGFDFGNDLFGRGSWLDKSINDFFVPEYIYHFEGPPEDERVPADVVRSIALQLRDYYREKFDLPPLTDEEKADWELHLKEADRPWDRVTQQRRKRDQNGTVILEFKALTDSQAETVARYMREHYPEVTRYQKAILQLASAQGYNTEDEWIDPFSIRRCMDDCFEACFGPETTPNQAINFLDCERIAKYL